MPSSPPPSEVSWCDSRFAGEVLRTRFHLSRRVRRFFIVFLPWLDALLLAAFVLFAACKHSFLPGEHVDIDFPITPFEDGAKPGIVLVVNSGVSNEPAFVIFDGIRYTLSDARQQNKLVNALRKAVPAPADSADAVLFVDRAVPFERLTGLLTLLRQAGLSRVFFATRTP